MGLLDSVLGSVLGGNSSNSPIQGVLSSILSGNQGGGPATGSQPGLGGLLQRFTQAGYGGAANSWVGNGPNQPIPPEALQNVFGQQQVNQWAQQTGMEPHGLLSALSQFLPQAVDKMTPGGQLPAGSGSPFDEAGTELPSGGSRFT